MVAALLYEMWFYRVARSYSPFGVHAFNVFFTVAQMKQTLFACDKLYAKMQLSIINEASVTYTEGSDRSVYVGAV